MRITRQNAQDITTEKLVLELTGEQLARSE